ncbi:MAG: hypothetical protein MJ170_01210 [Alphaproteobacteria bacterium]|nr:hypothetical protein [Alphaproteobacteria bacterium]
MKTKKNIFNISVIVLYACCFAFASNAAVVQRGATAARRTPTVSTKVTSAPQATKSSVSETVTTPEPVEVTEEIAPEPIIENKASQFSTALNDSVESDSSDSTLAAKIRAQRAQADAAAASEINNNTIKSSVSTKSNSCDSDLRKCMQETCGSDYAKCAGDTDTTWGNKVELCRVKTKCSAHEYALFAPEIKADRDTNAQIASYNEIVNCGNEYNNCIVTECGTKFTKCLGKSAGDKAIANCAKIAQKCIKQDSGLAGRVGSVFGTLRVDAEKHVQNDEKRLYELRDKMREQCSFIGAMFDERTLDCVYTINFFANNSDTPYASKKAYAGSTFDCSPNYFGIDITTFKENAYRLTREQTAASSAMLGSGVGTAVGAFTSSAVNRSIDTTKAENDLRKSCKESGMKYDAKAGKCVKNNIEQSC